MGRVDLGCFGGDEWESACHDIVPDDACPDEQLACTYGVNAMALIDLAYEGTPCADGDLSQSEMLAQDSCVHLGGTYDYPDTFVHVIQGREDCSEAAPLGMLYANAITSDKEISWVDAPHGVFQTQAGALAIRDTILSECYDRH